MKKPFFAFLALLLLTLTLSSALLSACKPEQASRNGGKIELAFWTLQLLTFESTIRPMIAEYEKLHPNVRIKWVDIPFSEGEKRTLTAIMSPDVPDVINLNPDFSAVLASRGALVNLGKALTPEQAATYLPVAWQAATIRQAAETGEEIMFGLPWYVTSSVTLYNRKLLKQAGFSAPPAGYQALPAFARKLHAATGAYAAMPIIAERGNYLKELQKIGIPLYDARSRASFVGVRAIEHLEMMVELYRDGLIPAETLTEGHRAAVDRYQSGTLAMLLTGPNFLNIVKENAPEVFAQTDVAPQFPADANFKDFSLMLLVVPRKSPHPKEAVAFARFMTNKVNQMALAQVAPVLPSVTEALKEPYFSKLDSRDLVERARGISAHQLLAASEAYRIQPNQNEINAIMDYYVQLALLGKMEASEALQKAQDGINKVLESNAAP